MPQCEHCGSHVSDDFHRVFAVDGDVEGCPHCKDQTLAADGTYRESKEHPNAEAQA